MAQPEFKDWLDRKPAGPKPRKPIARSTKRVPQMTSRRRRQRAEYSTGRVEYLRLHPLCQLTIAYHRLDEAGLLQTLRAVGEDQSPLGIRAAVRSAGLFGTVWVPYANQIHHRNKGRGARLTDSRWFASASQAMHDWVEAHKDQARQEGYLLPLEADLDGRLPNGGQCLTTDEWLSTRARNKS